MQRKVIGGIYHYPEEPQYYFLFMNNATYLIEGEMNSIDKDVEHGLDKNLVLLDGYALASVKTNSNPLEYEWQIRNSGVKHTDKYIIARGKANSRFNASVTKFSKLF